MKIHSFLICLFMLSCSEPNIKPEFTKPINRNVKVDTPNEKRLCNEVDKKFIDDNIDQFDSYFNMETSVFNMKTNKRMRVSDLLNLDRNNNETLNDLRSYFTENNNSKCISYSNAFFECIGKTNNSKKISIIDAPNPINEIKKLLQEARIQIKLRDQANIFLEKHKKISKSIVNLYEFKNCVVPKNKINAIKNIEKFSDAAADVSKIMPFINEAEFAIQIIDHLTSPSDHSEKEINFNVYKQEIPIAIEMLNNTMKLIEEYNSLQDSLQTCIDIENEKPCQDSIKIEMGIKVKEVNKMVTDDFLRLCNITDYFNTFLNPDSYFQRRFKSMKLPEPRTRLTDTYDENVYEDQVIIIYFYENDFDHLYKNAYVTNRYRFEPLYKIREILLNEHHSISFIKDEISSLKEMIGATNE